MIRVLRDWWRRRRQEKRRLLLEYWDGQRTRKADPWYLYRALLSQQEVDIVAVAPLVDQMQEPETSQVVGVIARAFQVHRWDPVTQTGLTDCEILNLMGDLDAYLLAVKKKFSVGPTLQPPTA